MPGFRGRPLSGRAVFQRRHYEALAEILAEQANRRGLFDRAELSELVDSLCEALHADNPGFKPDLFRKAVWRTGQ
jgi:hypothetical protein